MKSNAWFSTFTVTLDISQLTNPPAISLIWPKDGTSIGSDLVTLRGTVADGNMQVSAVVTDEAGNSENIEGLVERDGTFWLDDVGLTGATNSVLITVTDPAGNMTTTNIALFRAPVTVGMTDPSDYELLQPTISLTGTIDSSEYDVWVNGQQAMDNGDGTWSATNVPVNQGGTATFHAVAIPKSANATAPAPGSAIPVAVSHASVFSLSPASPSAVHAASTRDVPAKLSVASHLMGLTFDHDSWWGDMWDIHEHVISWSDFSGGQSQLSVSAFNPKPWINPPAGPRTSVFTQSNWGATGPGTATTIVSFDSIPGVPTLGSAPRPTIAPYAPVYPWEQACRWKDVSESIPGLYYWPGTEAKDVRTIISLATGGRSGVNRRNLFTLTGQAFDTSGTWIPTATPLYPFPYYGIPEILSTSLQIQGQPLGNDGRRYRTFPDNSTIDVTLHAPGYDNYAFSVTATKHRIFILANGLLLDPDRVRSRAKFAVGQKVNFSYVINPPIQGEDYSQRVQHWHLPSKFINSIIDRQQYPMLVSAIETFLWAISGFPHLLQNWLTISLSPDYVTDPTLFDNETTPAWFISGGFPWATKIARVAVSLAFQNGQAVSLTAKGVFDMHRPETVRLEQEDTPDIQFQYGGILPVPYLALGQADLNGSMRYRYDVKHFGFNAKINLTQLIRRQASNSSTLGAFYADGGEFYNESGVDIRAGRTPGISSLYFMDGPAIPCLLWSASVSDEFQDYIRYRPEGADSIWVTIGRVDWNWGADASTLLYLWTSGWMIDWGIWDWEGPYDVDSFPSWNGIVRTYQNFGQN